MTSRLTTHQFHNKRPSIHLKVEKERTLLYTPYPVFQFGNEGVLLYTQDNQGFNHEKHASPFFQATISR